MRNFGSHGLGRMWGTIRFYRQHLLTCSILLGSMVGLHSARAQKEVVENQSGFSVRKASQNVADGLADFERYRDKNQWEKAFTAMGKVLEAPADGLVPDKDGLFIQAGLKIRAELLSLPPAGREAYRLFNDPKAEQLLNEAVASSTDPRSSTAGAQDRPDDVVALRKIVDKYFITSAGDKAADRLGDALFETGNFDGAERVWRMIVENYPDSGLSAALLQTKRGIALARAGQWEKLDAVRKLVHDRFAGQTIHLGGKDVDAGQYLDDLAKGAPSTTQPAVATGVRPSTMGGIAGGGSPIALPTTDTPVWQIPLMDQATSDRISQQLGQIGWGGYAGQILDVLPATASDEKRIYINWLGTCFAADLTTGKMLWRTNSFVDFGQNVQQMMMQGQMSNLADGAIEVVGNRLLVIKAETPNPRMGGQNLLTRLNCLAADTGKAIWQSERQVGKSISNWSFVGTPLVSGDLIYVCAHTQQASVMNLVCIDLAKGEYLWNVELGTAAAATDFRGMPRFTPPSLLEHDGKLYLLTNNGALLCVDTSSHAIDWAYSYGAHVENGEQRVFYQYPVRPTPAPSGAMLVVGSTMYFKETGGETLYALDLSTPMLKWKRPVDASVGLAAGDDRNLYLAGTEVDCINVETRDMLWSNRLSLQSKDMLPLSSANGLYVFDSRGVHEVKTDTGDIGAVFRGYDREALGGNLSRTADRLITISSGAITAYPLTRSGIP